MLLLILGDLPVTDPDLQMEGGGGVGKKGSKWLFYDKNPLEK